LKAILDTSVLIATDVPPLEGELAISAAALAELHFGVLVTTDAAVRAERLRRLSDFQGSPDVSVQGPGKVAFQQVRTCRAVPTGCLA